jgi:hypothetical protein
MLEDKKNMLPINPIIEITAVLLSSNDDFFLPLNK